MTLEGGGSLRQSASPLGDRFENKNIVIIQLET